MPKPPLIAPYLVKDGYETVLLHYKNNFPFAQHKDELPTTFERVHPHFHKEIEILHFIKGEALVTLGQQQTRVRTGETVIIGPYLPHAIDPIDNAYCCYYTTLFDPDWLAALADSLYYPFFQITAEETVTELITAIIREVGNKDSNYQIAVQNHLYLLFVWLLRQKDFSDRAATCAKTCFSKVKPIMQHLHEHFTEKITIDELCRTFHMSEPALNSNFKKALGKSVVQYVNFLRCQNAYTMITSGEYTVSEAAYRSGFQNLSYFTRKYRAYYRVCPSESKPIRQKS